MICSNVSVTFRFFMIFPLDEFRKLLGTEERMLVKFWHESCGMHGHGKRMFRPISLD